MKSLKSILSAIIVLCMVLSLCTVPVFAETTEKAAGTIVGDSKIYLPKATEANLGGNKVEAVKLTYNLVNAEGADVADNVKYSIVCNEADWQKWLDIDEITGDLYIATSKIGVSFTVKAVSDTYEAELPVTVANENIYADFDDEVIPSWITPYNGSSIKKNGDNPYLNVAVAVWNDSKPAIDLTSKEIVTSHLAVDLKFMVATNNVVSTVTSTYPVYPLGIIWDKTVPGWPNWKKENEIDLTVTSKWKAVRVDDTTATLNPTRFYLDSGRVYNPDPSVTAGSYTTSGTYDHETKTFSDFNFVNLEVDIKGNTRTTTLDGTSVTDSVFLNVLAGATVSDALVKTIYLGGAIDDLSIYTGEKVAYESFATGFEMVGDSIIARAPADGDVVTANLNYNLETVISGTELPESIVWSLEKAPTGVSLSSAGADAILSVAGDSTAGSFSIIAKSGDYILAKKDVVISAALANWTYDQTRYYTDFENLIVGRPLVPRLKKEQGGNNWDDYALVAANKSSHNYSSQTDAEAAGDVYETYNSVIKEKDGNKYASSTGYLHWDKNGATAYLTPKTTVSGSYPVNLLDSAQAATFEGKFMIESSAFDRIGYNGYWSLLTGNSGETVHFDIVYKFVNIDVASIILNMENGVGGKGAKTLLYVPVDKWFDIRVEFDNSNDTFDMYVNNVLVVDDEKHTLPSLHTSLRCGCAFDNPAYYNGRKAVTTVENIDSLEAFVNGEEIDLSNGYVWSTADEEDTKSSASAVYVSNADYTDYNPILVGVVYDNAGKLIAVDYIKSVKSEVSGLTLGASALSVKATANASYKVFVLKSKTLIPVK